jgi:hypothetical protein
MDSLYFQFFHDLYRKTAGFITAAPLGQAVYPGDFFQIRNQELVVLGNIYMNRVISAEQCSIGAAKKLNEHAWKLDSGISKPYAGRGRGEDVFEGQFEYSRQLLAFEKRGSYIFRTEAPESVGIANWPSICDELIIKLTQTNFSFREVYVVTECATAAFWTLAIAGAEQAELEIATDHENFGLQDIFGHASSKTIQSKDLESYHRHNQRVPNFFKAKRLAVKGDKLQLLLSDLENQRLGIGDWARDFFDYPFAYHQAGAAPFVSDNLTPNSLEVLRAGDMNPNTALSYFQWTDTSLDDVNRLFKENG